MTTETLALAGLTLLGSGTVAAAVGALFARRKTAAEADLTVGEAWGKFVEAQNRVTAEQVKETSELRRDNSELRGELRAARESIAQLERRERESIVWQAQVTARENALRPQLEELGVTIPPMPSPPTVREVNTRMDDTRGAPR